MHRSKCPACGSNHSVKNGTRKGIQLYKCADCGYQFRNNNLHDDLKLWSLYQDRKQTVAELTAQFHCSESTIKRCLRNVSIEWVQPEISGEGFVHLDATYWGHNWGFILALDSLTGKVLYLEFIQNETNADYEVAVSSIEKRGYKIKGIVIDGRQSLFSLFSNYNIQMCQFLMKQIIKRYLTQNPRFKAGCELRDLVDELTITTKSDFEQGFCQWKENWKEMLNKRSNKFRRFLATAKFKQA